MTLRSASVDDTPAMAAAHATAFEAPWSAGEIASLMASPGAFAFLVADGDAAAGFILCRAIAGEAEVLTLAVRPEVRRRGVARALLEAAIARARVAGAASAFLEVAESNIAAIALYRGAGFAEVGRRRGYYAREGRPAEDALALRRELHA